MSLDFDDDAYLPPATGGMAKADTPKQAVNPEEEAKASFTNGETTVNTDGTAKEASQEEKGNIHSSDWVGGFEDDVTPPKPPTIIAPEVARLNTPITPFNQQQLRVGKTIEGLNKETASFDELMGGIRDDLTKESFISLVAQGQADNANSYVSYHFDAEINKHNPAFKRFEKDNGHAKYTQLFVNVEVVENPNTDNEVKRPYRKFQTDQEGFGYYYPDLAKYALKRKVITEEIEADTTHGKERAPLLTRLGDPETYIDFDGNTLSIEDRRAKAFELATGVNKKRTFEITVKDYINSISNEAKYTWTDLNLKGAELPTALEIEAPVKDDPAKIDVLANPSHEYTYQVYRPAEYMPTAAEVLALTKDMSATIRITYEPKLAKEVSAHEHLVRSLSSEGIRSFKDISIRGLQKLDTPDNGNDMKARLSLTDSEGHVKDDVLVTYKRTEPKTGPYVDVIQGSLTKQELSADDLQKVSPSMNDPKYQLLKDGKEGKVVLSKKVLKYEQNARKNHRMFSYNGLTAYPEVLTNMSKEILPFVFKDLVPGHYSIESTMDEIKASGKVKVKAVESSPLYTGEVESHVKVFSPSEHMLNSVLTGFANTDAIFKDSVVEAMARDDWEKRFDIGTVGISGYGFSPYKLIQGDKGQKTADLQYFLHDIPLNYHYLRRYNEFFAHPSVNSPMGTNEKEAEQLSHIGRFASPNFARLTWGIQHSQLLNQTPFYYRKRAKDSFKQALFNNLVREKKLTPDWTYRVSDEGLITGYIDNNEPGVKYKNDIVMDAWHPQFLYRKGGMYDTVAMTRALHPNGLIYHYPNISSKYEQDDIRFASQSAYAMTRDGTALHDNRVRNVDAAKDAYPHPFDTSNRTNNTRYDWMLSDVYLKSGTLVDVLDYINSAQERYKRYRTVFNKSDNTTEFTGKNSFLAKASKSLYDRVQGQTGELPESVVEKVFSNRAFNTVSSPFGDNLITVRDEKAGKVVLAPSAVLADPNIYIPYGMSSYAFQAANKDDTDAQYIQYLLNRGQTNRYLADHTYLADYLKEKAYQALPKTILINETPEAGDFALEALPNMAFYRSKVNYASGNQLNKFQLFNFEKGNNVGKDNITPVRVGKVKVITQDTDEHLNAKFNMGYVKPHIAESLAISLKERRDYGINGLHTSATGIYKPYPYHTSSVFDGYKVQHPQKGDNAFGELNISITENEFFNLYHELFPTVTITPNVEGVMEDVNAAQQNPVTITYSDGKENHKPDIDYLEKILTKLVARYVTDTTGWKESDFEVALGKDEDTAALGSFATPADVAKLNTKETLITKFLKPLYTKFKEATSSGGGYQPPSYYYPMRLSSGEQHGNETDAIKAYFDKFLYKANNAKSELMTKEESEKAKAAEQAKEETLPDKLQLETVLFDLDSIRLNTPITQLTNFYVKVKVVNPEYLYGTLHANVSFSIADSQLNLGRESLITGITLNDFNTNMSAVTAFSNSNFSNVSASRLGYNVHFGDLKFGDSNASSSPNAPTGLHSRETFKVLRHLATQVNPHSDIFADYDLAATSPIYADLSEMRKVFNYNDGSLDESLKDPLVPASLHRYLSPEVKQYLRLRGFELMAEGKLNNVYYYANEIPVAYRDARYIGLAHSTAAYNATVTGTAHHETAGTKAKFIRRSMNRYGVAMANNDLMKTNPDSYFKEALYTQLPGENLYDDYFATQHDAWKYYYGFFHSLPVVEAPFYHYTNHAGARVIEKNVTYTDEHQQALGYYQGRDMKPGSLITQHATAKYEYKPVKQTTRLSTDYRPGVKVGMKYPYIAKFNDAVNVTYYLDHKRVDPAEVEKLKELTDTTLKLDPETLVSGLNVAAVWHKGQDPYYYDNNQLSILDYLDAVRYGHFDYQTGEIKDMLFSHTSMKAIMENIGRYGIKTKAVDESVLHSKHTVEFFENKFMYFLKHIGYFFVSKFYDTRHLWSGVQTYTKPEETFEAWGLKSNALVWFDLPEYMKLFKRVFTFNFGSTDTMALSKAICPDGANNNGYIFHLMWNMEESDNGTKWQLHHPRVSPVALVYTRRPTPSFDYKVTVGMNTYQAKYLAEHPDDLTRNPGRYKDVWSTFEIPTNLGKTDGKPVLAGFQGMITPLIKQKWYQPEGDNSESFLLQNLTKEESLKYWPNIDDNYEFDKFKSSLDWFGHDRIVMINKHDYTKLVTDEDLLFVTNRDDAKRIMLIGTNSRTNFLSQVVRYSEQNTDKSVEKVDEIVLAKAMLKANGKLNTEFKLIPSANHPLYFGEATVTYSTFGSGDGPNIIRGYADEIWLNTTMLDYRRFLAEEKLRIETVRPDYARMSPIIEENPDFIGDRDHPIHRYRHISDHALPWLFPGLFIAEEVNYKALIKHIEYLNEHFKNEDGSEKWSMDFLKFINPGYRTAGIPFVTLNHRELAELTGYRLQRLPTTIIPGTHKYKRGQTVHWNLNNLIGKFEGDDLYALLKAREGGNVIGKLTPIPNPYPDAWRKYFKDEAGQVFEAYDDGSLKLMSTSTKFLQQRQVANATRTPYTANLGVRKYGRLFETEDQANTQYYHMEGHTLLARLEQYSEDEIINRVTRAKELGLDVSRALGGLSNEVSPRLNSRIEQLHNHFADHFINKHVQLADYGIDMPIEPMAVDLEADSKERALMVTPALLGKHNYVTLKDYRYTVTVPGAFNDSYDTITYRLSDNFIDSLFTGKRVNKMFEVVEEIKNHELFEKGLGKGGIELGQMQEIQDGIIHAKLPVDTGVAYMGIVTESINRNQLSEEYRKAFGEELRSEYSYEKVQLATAYPSLMSPETDDAEYESLKKRIRGVGMLPFQTPSNIMGTGNDDDDSDARGYAKGNYKVARSTLGKKTYIQPLSVRGFAQELTYTYMKVGAQQNLILGGHVDEKSLRDDIVNQYQSNGRVARYPIHGLEVSIQNELPVEKRMTWETVPEKTESQGS